MITPDDSFSGVVPFVHVAEERSFRRAAERLGVSTAAVSKAVARLEERVGVALLNRTSRQVDLTPEGAAFLERCRAALDQLQAGRELLAQAQRIPQGTLRVSMSPILGRTIVPRLGALAARHPRLSFELSVTDRLARLSEEGVDVAVRIGRLEDSALVSRNLGRPRWTTVASPAYLAGRRLPRTPADLAEHDCLRFVSGAGAPREWTFGAGKAGASGFAPPGRFDIDNGDLLIEAAVAGLGVAQVFDFMVADHVREGRLVEVLAPHSTLGPPIHALCLPRRQRTPRVRVLIDLLARTFDEVLSSGRAR